MRILQLCNKLPFPQTDGGAIAIGTLTEGLLMAGCEVKVLAMNTKKHFTDLNTIPDEFRSRTGLETVELDTDVKAPKALMHLLMGKSYNVSRFYSNKFKDKLVSILKKDVFDLILLEGLYLTPYLPYIRRYSSAPAVLRAHNVEWMIWQRLMKEERFRLKRSYLAKLAAQLREYESKAVNLCDGIMVFTEPDRRSFEEMGCKTPITVIPFGVMLSKYIPEPARAPTSLFFIGALDWRPNLQGLEWFLEHVWKRIYSSYPTAQFHIAGRNMPTNLRNYQGSGVILHERVENAITYMKNYGIMLVPLFAGSGVRVKIIEGMALQKTIIATTIGAEGIDYKAGIDIIIANTYQEFFDEVKRCMDDKEYVRKIGMNARNIVEEKYNIEKLTATVIEFFKKMITNEKPLKSSTV